MPATLRKQGDVLSLSLSGHPDFQQALAAAKRIPGRRYNAAEKVWEFPADEQLAMRIVHTVNPQPDATIMSWLRDASAKVADELTTRLPDDAELSWRHAAALYQFQKPAVAFAAVAKRTLILDDMGLGKTVTSIGAVQEYLMRDFSDKPKLVLASSTKLGDWARHIKAWTDDPVTVVPGNHSPYRRERALVDFERFAGTIGGWLVVNHEQIRAKNTACPRCKKTWQLKQPWFETVDWGAIVVDEAHRFKNKDAQQTGGLLQLNGDLRYMLTGTPIINAPDELWALLAFIRPDVYKEWASDKITYWQFYNTYVESYEIPGRGRIVTGAKDTDSLRFELADKMVRRTKRVLRDRGLLPAILPARTTRVEMGPWQRKLYEQAEREMWLAIERDVAQLPEAKRRMAERQIEEGDTLGEIIRYLPNAAATYAAQKQIATSPALIGGPDDSAKLDAVVEDVLDHPEKPFVAYTWHVEAARVLTARLRARDVTAEALYGDVTYEERDAMVRRFQEAETRVLVATIKTGGEGLDLYRADTALFVERSERVMDNDQAVSRLHRLGQQSAVSEVIYQTEGTIETGAQEARLRMKELIIGATMGRDERDTKPEGTA